MTEAMNIELVYAFGVYSAGERTSFALSKALQLIEQGIAKRIDEEGMAITEIPLDPDTKLDAPA